MISSTRIFFAGVGTTFAILAVGFGGGLIIAKTAMAPEPASQSRGAAQKEEPPVRVVLPASNDPAQPPQAPSVAATVPPAPALGVTQQAVTPAQLPLQEARQQPVENVDKTEKVEKVDTQKTEAEERERKRRDAERKARRQAEARARQFREQRERQAREPGILAFRGDNESPRAAGFFGN
jgi:type IV secretory pathway VirB10-like protein